MRTMRAGAAWIAAAVVASISGATSIGAQQGNDPYPATLHYGTGLINTPVAWVSPTSGDGWFNISGKRIQYYGAAKASFATQFNTNVALDTHWAGRFSLGVSAYSQNPEWGLFGQALLLRDNQVGFLPGLAVGVRNVGKYKHEERFLIGHDIRLNPTTGEYEEVVLNENFKTSPSFYGVATKEFSLSSVSARLPATMMSFSVGYGNGLFSDDGDLGDAYNDKGTIVDGLFLGSRFVTHPTLNSTLTVLAENDAWDWNAGVVFNYRGLSAGLYGTELEEGGREKNAVHIYNYTKINFALGYSGNVFDVARGVILRTRITDLTREQQRLRMDIAERNRRIAGLEVTLRRAQAGELTDIARRRAELESQISEDREAIRRATERLTEIERSGGRVPPPTTPPPTQPPPTQPPPTQPPPSAPSSPSL
jgi:uncharacterized coiled-coil protein SlyX